MHWRASEDKDSWDEIRLRGRCSPLGLPRGALGEPRRRASLPGRWRGRRCRRLVPGAAARRRSCDSTRARAPGLSVRHRVRVVSELIGPADGGRRRRLGAGANFHNRRLTKRRWLPQTCREVDGALSLVRHITSASCELFLQELLLAIESNCDEGQERPGSEPPDSDSRTRCGSNVFFLPWLRGGRSCCLGAFSHATRDCLRLWCGQGASRGRSGERGAPPCLA